MASYIRSKCWAPACTLVGLLKYLDFKCVGNRNKQKGEGRVEFKEANAGVASPRCSDNLAYLSSRLAFYFSCIKLVNGSQTTR